MAGTEACECVDGACFDALQCWKGLCTSECNENPDTNDEHCGGECGNACTITGEYGGCEGGVCQPHLSDCFSTQGGPSCPAICSASGFECTTCDDFPYFGFGSEDDCEALIDGEPFPIFPPSCDVTPFYSTNQSWARCCCV